MAKKYLITGGAGFIGSNYAARLIERGEIVTVYDNLSRTGTIRNLEWLRSEYGNDSFQFFQSDIRDANTLEMAAKNKDVIVHLAGQVAVTTSVINPREDFEINALGTFNVLEAARKTGQQPVVIYASTNKVYGGMEQVRVAEGDAAYYYQDYPLGIAETHPLDFHSPYGCSKGAGDQYVRDYARIYQLPTVVMRQSCIYGTRQFGIEDQGWVAWFVIAALTGKPISIYGNGKQVRDVLFVDDLLNAYDAAINNINTSAGEVFNVGGGPKNTMSIWVEFSQFLSDLAGRPIPVSYHPWRPGDQKIYVSDIRKANAVLGWTPHIDVKNGLLRLFQWATEHQYLFSAEN
ncbi:MAG: GDP-mannose 4,6-dehydratase [Anaerolineae bacterium]|nr:GDP-mannose 4,6-dehydratase [Anaerolineae bacterium]